MQKTLGQDGERERRQAESRQVYSNYLRFQSRMRWPNTLAAALFVTLAVSGLTGSGIKGWAAAGLTAITISMFVSAGQGWAYYFRHRQ